MHARRLLAVAALGVLATCVAAAPASARLAAGTVATLTDTAGDSGAAPDITELAVGNAVGGGDLVLWIATPNRPALTGDDVLLVYLDVDRDPATGAPETGIDVVLAGDAESSALLRWQDGTFAVVDSPSLSWTQLDRLIRISVHPSELNGTTGFDYFVESVTGDASDYAPDRGFGSYVLSSAPLRLAAGPASASPKAPRAGRPFAVSILVVRGDTLDLLGQGKVTCAATVAGKRVGAAGRWRKGTALCSLRLPRGAKKGAAVRLTVTVAHGGAKASRTYTGKVR